MTNDSVGTTILQDMKHYYDARATEYDEWFYRRGRYDHGIEFNERWHGEAQVVAAALEQFSMHGNMLELAPGTGIWTERLVRGAESLTAVDASEQMIEINRKKLSNGASREHYGKISYLQADLFEWQPDRNYDGIFFAFWLSHIPTERLDESLSKVASALKPGGKVFFIDSRPNQTMSACNHKLPKPGSQVMKRILNDGRSFNIIKNFFEPSALRSVCAVAGLHVDIRETPHYFIYALGTRV